MTREALWSDALAAGRDTRCLKIGTNVLERVPAVFRDVFGGRPAVVVVADRNTFAAAGETVNRAFGSSGHETEPPYLFQGEGAVADFDSVLALQAVLNRHNAIPLAIGSGTINDLTKLAAFRSDRPYMCVATAASMDGYTAFGASITDKGLKQTFDCPAPAAVVADLDVIRKAPGRMNAWGYADLLAKVTAGADWIVADALGAEEIDPAAWAVVQGRLREFVVDAGGIEAKDSSAIRRLVEGLMVSGFAMQVAKSSRPASGAEHQFSHLWDMQHHAHRGCAPSHGFKVAIGTLAVTALYEELLEMRLENLDVERCCRAWPDRDGWRDRVRALHGGGEILEGAWRETGEKAINPDELRKQLEKLCAVWPELREKLRVQLIPFFPLRRMLRLSGGPDEPEDIGISRARLRRSYWQAFSIRRRFTVLDLAVRANVLERCLDRIFGPGGKWEAGITGASGAVAGGPVSVPDAVANSGKAAGLKSTRPRQQSAGT